MSTAEHTYEGLRDLIVKEQTDVEKWIELSTAEHTYEGLRDLIVKMDRIVHSRTHI